jgi:hypothetical protein
MPQTFRIVEIAAGGSGRRHLRPLARRLGSERHIAVAGFGSDLFARLAGLKDDVLKTGRDVEARRPEAVAALPADIDAPAFLGLRVISASA